MKRYVAPLTKKEREVLGNLVSKGKHSSQKILNALILLDCDTGEHQVSRTTNEEIARVLNISMREIDRVKKCFAEEGFDAALDTRKADRQIQNKWAIHGKGCADKIVQALSDTRMLTRR